MTYFEKTFLAGERREFMLKGAATEGSGQEFATATPSLAAAKHMDVFDEAQEIWSTVNNRLV